MDAIDFILDGLEEALALERELGVRSVACDRSLLSAPPPERVASATPAPRPAAPASASAPMSRPAVSAPAPAPRPAAPAPASKPRAAGVKRYDFVFLHDRPLSPRGVEMVSKAVLAMGRTAETAPVIVAPPLPVARIYVVLGWGAMKRYFPSMAAAPGDWRKTTGGADVLVTYSPEHLLRFGEVTKAVEDMKRNMWRSLKAVLQRLA